MLVSGADAVERLMTSYKVCLKMITIKCKIIYFDLMDSKEIVELAGYTSRVGNMLDVFEEVGRGQYKKPSIKGNSDSSQRQWETLRLTVKNGIPVATGKIVNVSILYLLTSH